MEVTYFEAAMAALGLASIVIGSFTTRLMGMFPVALPLPTKRQARQPMRSSRQSQQHDS